MIFLYATFSSIVEKEKRAALVFFIFALFFSGILILLHFLPGKPIRIIEFGFAISSLILIIIFFFPSKGKVPQIDKRGINPRFDERDVLFARYRFRFDNNLYGPYYRMRPENKKQDDQIRNLPGLCSPESEYYDKELFDKTDRLFEEVETLYPDVEGNPSLIKDPSLKEKEIYDFLYKNGVHSAAATALKPEHYYSYGGRGERFGVSFTNEHPFAIAFTVEMDKERNAAAPYAPTLLESAQQYYNSGFLATEVAKMLRNAGYEARAHIDGNYKLICPTVARDAGLGEIGRMGLLMTPGLGPRVRIAVVSTNFPFTLSSYQPRADMIDFCLHCKKCAINCPSNAIPHIERRESNGVLRWKINHEACFTYWCEVGTDCGKCMAVCPYSHHNNLLHSMSKVAIKNNSRFRQVAIKLDDLLYGKYPKAKYRHGN